MEVAGHIPLTRSHTTPNPMHQRIQNPSGPIPTLMGSQSFSSSQYSLPSHPSSRSSDSTQATASSTLFPSSSSSLTLVNTGQVEASDNVLNKKADKETSLFQICLNLQQRLRGVPNFEQQMLEETRNADEDMDPVTLLWRTFRKGYPLLILYNALNPAVPLEVDPSKVGEANRGKAATFKFLKACMDELKIPGEECFFVTDLYGDDTTGFVKVAKVVNRLLDLLVQQGVLSSTAERQDPASTSTSLSATKRTQRQHIIEELVKTERTYVQHLELLQEFKKLVEVKGVIPGDIVHDIFLNLNFLLDFQRRFLIRVEQTNAKPEDEQNWGKLFVLYKEAFKVYEPYIANQKRCEETVMREFDKLKETGGTPEMRQMVESSTHLMSFLLKPFQRLTRYPLLLKELRDKGDLDDERKEDINSGMEAASSVLQRTNAAVDREERLEAVQELKERVQDWKGHRVEGFGELLLYGTYTVLKGDSTAKDAEREYKIYLFEPILLCCKEINPNKQKNKITGNALDKKGKPKLQLKGRIFMQNVTDTFSFAKPGSYTCQIFWKGDPGIENFIIRFKTEETMRKWASQVDKQRIKHRALSPDSSLSKPPGTSDSEFTFMRDQAYIENPYRQPDDNEDDDDDAQTIGSGRTDQASTLIPGNGSTTSLRSRSTTGDSGPPLGSGSRVPPPRFPMTMPTPPLTLRTQQLQSGAGTPNERPGDSFFSPGESPISSRTSSSSGMFPFPRQPPLMNGWHGEEQNRYTAPAIAHPSSRDGPTSMPSSMRNGVRGPSLPTNSSAQLMAQSRIRSASSPDIHNPLPGTRRGLSGYQHPPMPDVPVPPFPAHYVYPSNNGSRSRSSSPNSLGGMPIRNAAQPPMVSKDRAQVRNYPESTQFDQLRVGARSDSRGPPLARTMTSQSMDTRKMSSPQVGRGDDSLPAPMQLKVKVHCPSAGSTMTLVVSTNISYQSLKDRIDAKLQRATNLSLSAGNVKLKYLDDSDYVSIQSDEDVQTAFETWREQQRDQVAAGQLGEIELYCQR